MLPPVAWQSVVAFAVAVVILLGPWPGYGRVFRVLFAAYGNAVVASTGAGGSADPEFRSAPPAADSSDSGTPWTVWVGALRGPRAAAPALPLDTRILGYTPLALLLALVVASPIPWRRRAAVTAIGASLLLARIALAVWLAIGQAFDAGRGGTGSAAEVVWFVLIDLPAMTYVAPLAAWAVGLALTDRARRRVSSNRR
ncbi:MAG: hypothetical protein ABUR63_09635 [Verrucomicrobiota bacterium]